MELKKKELTLEKALEKEWLLTNGIGGYSFSTILGVNTRKYHGLLVAPLTPPARRHVMLAKVDESIQIGEESYPIYTNIGKNYITKGYTYLQSFQQEYYPIFTYQVKAVKIEKAICMDYPRNTVCISYQIENKEKQDITLTIAPLVNYRDFHQVNYQHSYRLVQKNNKNKVTMLIDDHKDTPLYMYLSDGTYIPHENDMFWNMFYMEEEKRGFLAEENHAVPGRYEVCIPKGKTKDITFTFSLEENIEHLDGIEVRKAEEKRQEKILKEAKLEDNIKSGNVIKDLTLATDRFLVYRPSFRLHTIIAGYPWFLDWGRDAFISFEGLLLLTKRYDIAKEVLLTFMRDIKQGLVPNGYSGYDNRPLYNSVDASLLLFEQMQRYMDYTGDTQFVKEIAYPKLVEIIKAYQQGIDLDENNIYLDQDGLLVSGTETTQNTWMDAKYGSIPATPRNGKAVEINSMWYNALKLMEEWTSKWKSKEEAKAYEKLAKKCRKSFQQKFYCEKKKCLYDVLGDSKIRPNQLFSLSLTYPVLDPNCKEAIQMLETVKKKLVTPYGLKTLAKGESGYVDVYEGDGFQRDMSYHQGITWPWLLGIYFNALENSRKAAKTKKRQEELTKEIRELVNKVEKTYQKACYQDGVVGSINEIYDSTIPYLPRGAVAQAWSVAEVLKILIKGREIEK